MKLLKKAAAASFAVFSASLCGSAANAFAATVVPGDFNNDGKFNLMDITGLLKGYVNGQKYDSRTIIAADANNDGKLDLLDCVRLLNRYVNGETGNTSGGTSDPSGNDTNPEPAKNLPFDLVYKEGTNLRMAMGYNLPRTGISFSADLMGNDGTVTLADGRTYRAGDLKPTWQKLGERLKISFTDKYTGKSASQEYQYWQYQLDSVDVVSCIASQANEAGAAGMLVDLSKYLDKMPNFKAFLDANPIVRLSITGSTFGSDKGAIYHAPYFDGVNDVERVPLMRTDWVEKLLNGSGSFEAESCGATSIPKYTPYMPTSGKVNVEVVRADASGTQTITKNYDNAGNIIAKMNDAGALTGVEAVNMLRNYIDEAYEGYYGTNRADLFIGQNAAWDADELVALLRCVTANAQTLNGTDTVAGLFSRQENSNQRRTDMYRFAGTLFGARGLESRYDYTYIGADNKLHDARMETGTYAALEKMNLMAQEGLISKDFLNSANTTSANYLKNDAGFMSYDYNNTQTLFNENGTLQDGEMYRAVMIPVARWYDGSNSNGTYMRFTEAWRSVTDSGIALSTAGIGSDKNKLNAALHLIDYAYSKEGQILMSYGPDEFIKVNSNGTYNTFNFNDESWPEISDAARAEMWTKCSGNYSTYARYYLGSMLSGSVKAQAYEFQNSTEAGKLGAGYISNAIAFGTIKHPELKLTSNPWYTSMPAVLPLTAEETYLIRYYTELGSSGYFGINPNSKNLFVNIIANGYAGESGINAAQTISTIKNNWGCGNVLEIKQVAWDDLLKFYRG